MHWTGNRHNIGQDRIETPGYVKLFAIDLHAGQFELAQPPGRIELES